MGQLGGLLDSIASRPLYYGVEFVELPGPSVDGGAAQRICLDAADELKHLAKVRVAGSNPVFRSIVAGQSGFSNSRLGLAAVRSSPLKPVARVRSVLGTDLII